MSETDTPQIEQKKEEITIELKSIELVQPEPPKNNAEILVDSKEEKIDEVKPADIIINIPAKDFDAIAKEGLVTLIEKYLDDGVIDNEELVDIVKCTMEIVENKKDISGTEKKKVALIILRQFISDKVKDYDNLEKLFDKAIDLAVKVSKNGLESAKFSSETISDAKNAFNIIYASALTKINADYPQADDIINNLFDIALYVVQMLEGQTKLSDNEKKILLKKILQKVIISLESKFTIEQRDFLLSQIEPTISLVQIGIRAQRGEVQINPQEVVGFLTCICAWFRCCKAKPSPSKSGQ